MRVGRFAPSTTGEAHPGTLLAALLAWLDVRAAGGRFVLRLENLDHLRCKPGWAQQMLDDLRWFGLDWDELVDQQARRAAHEAALDQLAAAGRLYPCACSRRDRSGGRRGPDGGWAYPNTCRGRSLPAGGWRDATEPVRVRLDDGPIALVDESGLDLGQDPAAELGDPVVLRRDGVLAYQLVVVVDDAAAGVNRVVRGRDIAPSTATQVALQRLLGLPTPAYRHHLLLVSPHGDKLAKLHGSAPATELRARYRGDELCGLLAAAIGLTPPGHGPVEPTDLLRHFDWSRVETRDLLATWTDALVIAPPPAR